MLEQDSTEGNETTNEELSKALRESWEKAGGKTIEINEGEPTFDVKDFIGSLSYSKTQGRTLPS
jgi:hypothetical protein